MRPRCACPSTWARRPSASVSTWSSPPWACRPAATPSLVRRSASQPMACRLDASGQALQAGDNRGGGVNSVELSLGRILNQIACWGCLIAWSTVRLHAHDCCVRFAVARVAEPPSCLQRHATQTARYLHCPTSPVLLLLHACPPICGLHVVGLPTCSLADHDCYAPTFHDVVVDWWVMAHTLHSLAGSSVLLMQAACKLADSCTAFYAYACW